MPSTKTLALSLLAALTLAAVACKTSEAASSPAAARDAAPEQAPAPRASTATVKGDNFVVTAAIAPECKLGDACTMTIKLEALGAYHINDSYPYKFTPTLEPKDKKPDPKCENVEFGKEQFSKANGDFKKDGEKTATLTVTFKPTAPKGKIVGVYKMSVCSEQNCQLETKPLALDVDATK